MLIRAIRVILFLLVANSEAYADAAIDKAIWMGNAQDRIDRLNNPAEWYSLKLVANLYVKPGQKVDENNARETFNWFQWRAASAKRTFADGIPSDELEFANTSYEMLKASGSPVLQEAGVLLQYEAKKIANSPDQQIRRWQSYNQKFYDLYANKNIDRQQILSKIYDLAANDPAFARVFDEVWGVPLLNAKTDDTADKILTINPDFASNQEISRLVKSTGQNADKIDSLKKNVLQKISAVGKSLDEQSKSQQQLSTDIQEYFSANQRAQLESKRDEFEQRGLRSGIFILSYLMPDQRSARQVAAVGNAMLDFYNVSRQYDTLYLQTQQQNEQTQEMSNIGTAAATMNYIAIFITLAEALSQDDKGPTPEQIIMDEIKQLASLMTEFQDETRKRFDRIDETLATIFAQTTAELNTLSTQIGSAQFSIENVRGAVASIIVKLDQVEAHLTEYLRLIADQSYEHSMVGCLGQKVITGNDLSEQDYDKCVIAIQAFLNEAKTPALSGSPKAQPIVAEDSDWASSINSILAMASQKGGYQNAIVSNPVRWARAARDFSTLALENEAYFKKKPSGEIDGIISDGKGLNNVLSRFAPENPEKYLRVLKALLDEYNQAVNEVWVEANAFKKQATKDLGGTATWLNPDELRSQVLSKLPDFSQRDINSVGTWSAIDTDWSPQINKFMRDSARLNAKLDKLPQPEPVWRILSDDPLLFAPEFLGLATLYPRYFVDVYQGTLRAAGPLWVVTGEPLVTVFAYYVKPGETNPASGKSVAYVPYREGPRTFMIGGVCSGGYMSATVCSDLVTIDLKASGVVNRFDWDKFLLMNNSYSTHPIVRSPALKGQVDARLDDLLVAQQEKLMSELTRQGGNLYQAADRLNEVVSTIRALTAATLPKALYMSDKLRSKLFGRADISKCTFVGSRSAIDSANPSTELPIKDAVKSLGDLNQPASNHPAADAEIKGCPKDIPGSVPLMTRDNIEAMMHGSLNSKGEIVPNQINETTLLQNIKEIARASSEELLRNFAAATDVSPEENEHTFIKYELERLRTLKDSLQVASTANSP